MKKVISSIFILLFSVFAAHATHNRAGEITYRHLGGLTYEVTITTYTIENSADRCELELFWGDGTSDTLSRVNGGPYLQCPFGGEQISGADLKKNIYIGVHTYAGPDEYTIYFEDANRNSLVRNIPNSVNIVFYVETTLIINPFYTNNSTPVLLNPPIDDACIGKIFIHNPGAYDADGDSLAYRLDTCRHTGGEAIPGYSFPAGVSVDPITGDLIWNTPTPPLGEYNFAMIIYEYRNGDLIGTVTRDLQVTVFNCNNNPPEIITEDEICVEAGTILNFPVTATDPDPGQWVTLTATGGPLQPPNQASFFQPDSGIGSVTNDFIWQTQCSHVRLQPYQVFFKAKDNGDPDLVDFHTTDIYVVGPSPKNPQAVPLGTSITVSWDASVCSDVTGYKIYRRNGYYGFIPDECETGVPAYTGYSLIGTTTGLNSTTFEDDNDGDGLLHGVDYCYMIVACHPDGSESYASLEVCAELKKDVPILTHVTVDVTGQSNGEITVKWVHPTELDTVQIPGPYRYELYRSVGFNSTTPNTLVQTFFGNLLSDLGPDTIYTDTGLNTDTTPYHYEIKLFATVNGDSDFEVGSTKASSVYQSIIETDRRLILSWDFNVPWNNYNYIVYRFNDTTQLWDSIAQVNEPTYTDTGLINEIEYCYYIEAHGEYTGDSLPSPLINLSQEKCGVPIDTIPPCPPALSVIPNCTDGENLLTWDLPSGSCDDDATAYKIYFTPVLGGDMELVATIYNLSDTSYLHDGLTSIAGCYAITSIDSVLNESPIQDTVCVDNCPDYMLPNVFTPNGDNTNDFFVPFPYKYVESVDIKIYNRWGNLVFETTDPNIGWDGTNRLTKLNCSDGVYYYVCEVNEIYLAGVRPRVLTGFIELLRAK